MNFLIIFFLKLCFAKLKIFTFATMLQEINIELINSGVKIDQNRSQNAVNEEVAINSDFIGVGGSLLCLVHCVAPQLLALGSIGLGIGSFFASEGWTFFFFLTCLLAVWHSARKSSFIQVQLLLWVAFALFTSGLLLEFLTHTETVISYFGSAFLIFAHLVNFKKQAAWNRFLIRKKI